MRLFFFVFLIVAACVVRALACARDVAGRARLLARPRPFYDQGGGTTAPLPWCSSPSPRDVRRVGASTAPVLASASLVTSFTRSSPSPCRD